MIIRVFTSLLFAAYFIEVGLVLVITPWLAFWDQNYFARVLPSLGAILDTAAARGAVTGIGLVTCQRIVHRGHPGILGDARHGLPARSGQVGCRRSMGILTESI